MSALGVKRTWRLHCKMSANDQSGHSVAYLEFMHGIIRALVILFVCVKHSLGGNMQTVVLVIMTLTIGLLVTEPGFARKKDNPNFGYCEDGKKVADTTKCPKSKK